MLALSPSVLRESEARFRMLTDTAPVLIWMSGPDTRCTFLNRGWLEFTGRTTLRLEIPAGSAPAAHGDDGTRLEDVERRHILMVLERTRWRIRGSQGAADILGLKPTTLEARMAKLGIKRAPSTPSDV